MLDTAGLQRFLLAASAVLISAALLLCLLRAVLGPRFTNRIVAANLVTTKVTLLIAILSLLVGEPYLADVCLIYAVISFVAVVVLARSALLPRNGVEERP